MTSLTTAPIADVLERLFADAARTQAAFADRARRHPREAGTMDSREFFAAAKDVHLAVSRQTGTLLYILAQRHDRDHHPENHHRAGGRVAEDLSLTSRQHGKHDGKESKRCSTCAWEPRV